MIATTIGGFAPLGSSGGAELVRAVRPGVTNGGLSVVVEPDSGMSPLYASMTAKRTIDMVMYELRDPTAEAALAQDAARRVRVRVILDSTERSANASAAAYLTAHNVAVRWSSSRFDRTHEKAWVTDGSRAVISTGNLVTADEPGTRDFAVIDTIPADVAAIEATFAGDWAGRAGTAPSGVDLLWSPGSESGLLAVIAGARRTLSIENEEMDDRYVTSAIVAAAKRGVRVSVTMTADTEWDAAFAELVSAGVSVHVYPNSPSALYIHAKAIVADAGYPDSRVFVGSENFSIASLVYNRELGVVTTSPAIVGPIARVLAHDYAGGTAWK